MAQFIDEMNQKSASRKKEISSYNLKNMSLSSIPNKNFANSHISSLNSRFKGMKYKRDSFKEDEC